MLSLKLKLKTVEKSRNSVITSVVSIETGVGLDWGPPPRFCKKLVKLCKKYCTTLVIKVLIPEPRRQLHVQS